MPAQSVINTRLELARALAACDRHPGYLALLGSLRDVLADRDRLAVAVESLRERQAQPVSRWVVVGEADDKSLRGWTEGDKQESTVDELTVRPDAWPLGTVIEVYSGASS